jgi:hypothetical protein
VSPRGVHVGVGFRLRTSLALVGFLSAVALAGGSIGPVGEYGGHWVGGDEIRLLEATNPPVLRRIRRATLATSLQALGGADLSIDPYGVALPGDGTVWALADRGRFVFRFSEATGERVEKRRLAEPCQALTTLWNHAGFFAVRVRESERMLLREIDGRLQPFSELVSRRAEGTTEQLIANLVKCGTGTRDAVPCWFVAGEPRVLLLDRRGGLHPVSVPSWARTSPARAGSVPGVGFTYPIRDAFLLDRDTLWVLGNQDGDRTPLEEGALRGRHVSLVRFGRAERVVELPREARAILDASADRLVLLYADGEIERIDAR